jgi:hypothetical protein
MRTAGNITQRRREGATGESMVEGMGSVGVIKEAVDEGGGARGAT